MTIELEPGYRPSEDETYMSGKQLAYFRQKLIDWRTELMEEAQQTINNLRDDSHKDIGDEADRASRESDHTLELRTRDRYRKLLRKIDQALQRIEEGEYGYCEDTGEEIGLGRLEARPIATLTVEAQERREHAEKQTASGL
ncbi:MAG: RNA polymerase-binding protein DksA [Gammaproteobacteria bacterium]